MEPARLPRRGVLLMGIGAALLLGNGSVALAMSATDDPSWDAALRVDKVTICHATDAENNPYVVEHPAKSGDVSGHAGHVGPVWVAGSKAAGIVWGDIIPAFDYTDSSGATVHYPGLNWPAGQAIYDNNCNVPGTHGSPTPSPTGTISPTPDVIVTPLVTETPTPEGTVEPTSDTSPTSEPTTEPTTGGGGTIVIPSESPEPFTGGGGIVTLPHTGVPTGMIATLAGALLALGSWLTYAGRRQV